MMLQIITRSFSYWWDLYWCIILVAILLLCNRFYSKEIYLCRVFHGEKGSYIPFPLVLLHFHYIFSNKCWITYVEVSYLYRVRFHYGHPDVFDRLFHVTRGGVSKASKVINLSEDIFAGMECHYILLPYLFSCVVLSSFGNLWWFGCDCRLQFYTSWRQCHPSWIHTSWERKGCGSQSDFYVWGQNS